MLVSIVIFMIMQGIVLRARDEIEEEEEESENEFEEEYEE